LVELTGIVVEDFAHPQEKAALETMGKINHLERVLDWVANVNTQIALQTEILGSYFEITKEDMPWLYGIVRDVCRILDYGPQPRIYIHRSEGFRVNMLAGEEPLLVFPDFIVRGFDEGMLRFETGRAVTALKARTRQLKMAAIAVGTVSGAVPFAGEAMMLALSGWSRKAALTEDRGGLLACQNVGAAMKALMCASGLPMKHLDGVSPAGYIRAYEPSSRISGASQYLNTLVRMEPWNNDRIVELYSWERSGAYDDLLEEYGWQGGDYGGIQ